MSGNTPSEQAVLDLWDQGLGTRAIAQRLGRNEKSVSALVAHYAGVEPGQAHRDYRRGTAMLLAALRRHHPESVRAT